MGLNEIHGAKVYLRNLHLRAMTIESVAHALTIYVHAPLGGLALLAGGVALATKKGAPVHLKSGKLFYYSMLISALAAFAISVMPGHENPFLFCIGLFSSYFLVSGLRSLKLKHEKVNVLADLVLAWAILGTGIVMIFFPIILYSKINIVLSVFGVVAIAFGIRDFRLLRNPEALRPAYLKLHLGKMTGGYIAAVSAFLVVNDVLPWLWNWFLPGLLGSVYISFWIRKVSPKKA